MLYVGLNAAFSDTEGYLQTQYLSINGELNLICNFWM